jgi:hypothetical protein
VTSVFERLTPRYAVHLFCVANLSFLGVDIGIAHLENGYARRMEWLPIFFSALATALLLPGLLGSKHPRIVLLDRIAGWGAVGVGIAGMMLHLESAFFAERTLRDLVYSAPFVAPLSFVGVGLLVLLLRSDDASGPDFGPWVLVLALGGFSGNYALSLLDHAQNGFFHATEWVPVAAASLAIGVLAVELARPRAMPRVFFFGVMLLQVAIGVTGFGLHVAANLRETAASFVDRFVFGAPAFAPMLFADLALLALIGLWALRTDADVRPDAPLEQLESGHDP